MGYVMQSPIRQGKTLESYSKCKQLRGFKPIFNPTCNGKIIFGSIVANGLEGGKCGREQTNRVVAGVFSGEMAHPKAFGGMMWKSTWNQEILRN